MLSPKLVAVLPPPVRTPMLREGSVWVKPEGIQLGGSVKYRMVHAKLVQAIEAGRLGSETTLVEITAGSTGVALAYLGQKLGLKVELHAYDNAPPDKCSRIRECGANLILHPFGYSMKELIDVVARKVAEEGYWHLQQYDRKSTIAAYRTFGYEVINQIKENGVRAPKVFACPIGTGGLIQGLGTCLREAFPGIKIVSVEPNPDATIDGMRNTDKLYMGEGDPYDKNFPDERLLVPAPRDNAYVGSYRLGQSATAVYDMVHAKEWSDVLMIAPD